MSDLQQALQQPAKKNVRKIKVEDSKEVFQVPKVSPKVSSKVSQKSQLVIQQDNQKIHNEIISIKAEIELLQSKTRLSEVLNVFQIIGELKPLMEINDLFIQIYGREEGLNLFKHTHDLGSGYNHQILVRNRIY